MRYLLVVGLVFGGLSQAQAQDPGTAKNPVVRDAQAVVALQRAVAALGGLAVIAGVTQARTEGTITAADGDADRTGPFVWEDDFSAATYEFRGEHTTGGKTRIFVSGHGAPKFSTGEKVRTLRSHVQFAAPPFHLPSVLLARELTTADYSIRFKGSATVGGRPAIHIETDIATGAMEEILSPQDWYFDAASGLPVRVEYLRVSTVEIKDFRKAAADYSDYRVVDGIAVPFHLAISEEGSAETVDEITSFAWNPGVSPSEFDLPTGGGQ